MASLEAVRARQRFRLRPDWLQAALRAFRPAAESAWQSAPPPQLDAYLFEALLAADLAAALERPALPSPLDEETELRGPVMVQVSRAANICKPRLESVESCRPESRTLKLELTDGHSTVVGFELEPVPQLAIADFGVKLLLRGVKVEGSMLLLQKENVHVLGGTLAEAQAAYEAALRTTREEDSKAGKKRRIEEKKNGGGRASVARRPSPAAAPAAGSAAQPTRSPQQRPTNANPRSLQSQFNSAGSPPAQPVPRGRSASPVGPRRDDPPSQALSSPRFSTSPIEGAVSTAPPSTRPSDGLLTTPRRRVAGRRLGHVRQRKLLAEQPEPEPGWRLGPRAALCHALAHSLRFPSLVCAETTLAPRRRKPCANPSPQLVALRWSD